MSASPVITLLRRAWTTHRGAVVVIAAAVGFFEFILTRIAPAPNEVSWLTTFLTMLPGDVRGLIGNDVALSPAGFLALGYAHPFFMLLLGAWIVRTSTAAIAGEIGRGTMDLMAARPVPRWHFIVAGAATTWLGLAVILAVAWTATAVGLQVRQLDVKVSAFLPLVGCAWLLFAAWGAVGLAISASRRDGGQAITWTTAALAGSFVLDYIARLWAPASRLRPLSLFRYYEPQAILTSGLSRAAELTLGGTLLVSVSIALVVLYRRDL